jgi:vacuolar protein sorting-associated protein 72
MRNYLILSQVPGGLPAELKLILGDHVEWDGVQFIPARNRPINRRPPTCPFTGRPAKYRHPTTMIPYATRQGYREIEALLANRYVWNEEGGCWMGGEEDVMTEGMDEVEGWREAVMGGWLAGEQLVEEVQEEEELAEEPLPEPEPEPQPEPEPEIVEEVQVIPTSKSKKRKAPAAEKSTKSAGKGKKRKPSAPAAAEEMEVDVEVPESLEPIIHAEPKGKSKSKGKGKR